MVRFTEFAAELVRLTVDLIVAGGSNAAAAAQTATKTIPIVMVGVGAPVEAGYVASLARPGRNITGMSVMGQTLNAKRLQLLREAAVPHGVVLVESALIRFHQKEIVDLALKGGLPTIGRDPRFAQDGGLMSYGPDGRQLFQQLASFVDRILKGAPPGQLPIERPMRFYLVVNLKTAKTLGLRIPPALLLRADQVID